MGKTSRSTVRIALIQMSCSPDTEANLKKARLAIRRAASRGAQIVCLEELFRMPYFCQKEHAKNFSLAETVPGPTTAALQAEARASKTVVIAPVFEKKSGRVYHNTAAVIDADGKYLGKYRKMHIPEDPGFYEKFYFAPGDMGFKVFRTRHANIGVLICWDQWFPEAARIAALKGADILFFPTAIGWKPGKPAEARGYRSAWETAQRAHAISNGVFVACVNRTGREGDLKFWGNSFVADPFGKIVAQAGETRDEILLVDCDLSKIKKTREEWPFFRDRRIDAYRAIHSTSLDAASEK